MSPSLHCDSAALSYPCAKLHKKVPQILVLFNQIRIVKRGFIVHLAATGRFQNSRKGSTKEGFFFAHFQFAENWRRPVKRFNQNFVWGRRSAQFDRITEICVKGPLPPSFPPPSSPFSFPSKKLRKLKLFYSFGRSKKNDVSIRTPTLIRRRRRIWPKFLGQTQFAIFSPANKKGERKILGQARRQTHFCF